MTRAVTQARERGSEGERPADNARRVRGTKGLLFPRSPHGRSLPLLLAPTDNGRKTFPHPGVPPGCSHGLSGRGCAVWAQLGPRGFAAFFRRTPPCRGAAGGSWWLSVSLCRGDPAGARPRGVAGAELVLVPHVAVQPPAPCPGTPGLSPQTGAAGGAMLRSCPSCPLPTRTENPWVCPVTLPWQHLVSLELGVGLRPDPRNPVGGPRPPGSRPRRSARSHPRSQHGEGVLPGQQTVQAAWTCHGAVGGTCEAAGERGHSTGGQDPATPKRRRRRGDGESSRCGEGLGSPFF